MLADAVMFAQASQPLQGFISRVPEIAPDALLRSATSEVIAGLKQEATPPETPSSRIAGLVEAAILPLLDFPRMTRLALARDWPRASLEQQDELIAAFRILLVRIYATALTNYRDQPIEYKPLRLAPGQSEVTVRSTVKQAGAERMPLDYDMEKTTAGWKVYDIKIGGISLIATYRSTFAQSIRDGGVEGLLSSLAAKNAQAEFGARPGHSEARPFIFLYSVMPRIFQKQR